jgi:hypothetical protein
MLIWISGNEALVFHRPMSEPRCEEGENAFPEMAGYSFRGMGDGGFACRHFLVVIAADCHALCLQRGAFME